MTELRAEVLPKARSTVYLRRAENLVSTMELAEKARNADGMEWPLMASRRLLRSEMHSRSKSYNVEVEGKITTRSSR